MVFEAGTVWGLFWLMTIGLIGWAFAASYFLKRDRGKTLFWLGPIGAYVFAALVESRPDNWRRYVWLIVVGYWLAAVCLLWLLS